MKRALIIAVLTGLVLAVGAYAARTNNSLSTLQKQATIYRIEQIEQIWHKAQSNKNLDLMMSSWARNATATVAGKTVTGKAAIRQLFAKAGPFQPENHWISDTATYKMRVTMNGNRGTLYFECHFIDVDTGKVATVVGADLQVQQINGRWLITNMAASTVTLRP